MNQRKVVKKYLKIQKEIESIIEKYDTSEFSSLYMVSVIEVLLRIVSDISEDLGNLSKEEDEELEEKMLLVFDMTDCLGEKIAAQIEENQEDDEDEYDEEEDDNPVKDEEQTYINAEYFHRMMSKVLRSRKVI